jgi:hypothetical protein
MPLAVDKVARYLTEADSPLGDILDASDLCRVVFSPEVLAAKLSSKEASCQVPPSRSFAHTVRLIIRISTPFYS